MAWLERGIRGGALALVSALLLGLVGCGKEPGGKEPGGAPEVLTSKVETLEMQAPGCPSPDECTSVSIRREVFADHPALNDAIYEQLLKQLQGNGESDKAPLDSLDKVAQKFIDDAAAVSEVSAAQWQLNGDAKKLARRGDVLTIVINSYLFTGGAHGMPMNRWLNWDLAEEKSLSLDDVIASGNEEEFWTLAEEAHKQWLDSQTVDSEFRQNWPFARTEDFRLTDKGMVLLYGVYTLGPYSMGEVELTLPQEELAHLLRAPYR